VQVDALGVDRVRLRLPFRSDIVTIGDMVHGGAIGALVDIAATAAVWSGVDLRQPAPGITVGFTVNFLAACRRQDLLATAEVVRRGRAICVCQVDVRATDGSAVARALVTYKQGA
jgi:uncharacterized protein (TIGR00369 family)